MKKKKKLELKLSVQQKAYVIAGPETLNPKSNLHKQIKMVLENFTYEEVRSGLESFSFEEWWDVKESLHAKIPSMDLDKLSLYDFKQITYRMYGVVPEYDYLETVH